MISEAEKRLRENQYALFIILWAPDQMIQVSIVDLLIVVVVVVVFFV